MNERLWSCNELYSVPLFIRLQHLYAIGYDTAEIAGILQDEFQDLEVNPVTFKTIEETIQRNKPMLEAFKQDMAQTCIAECKETARELYELVYSGENRMVKSMMKKLDQLILAMDDLDLTACDDTGRPLNVGVYFTLMETFERTQKFIAKIAGTDAFREMQIHQAKTSISNQGKGGNLLPPESSPAGPSITG